MRSKTGSPGSPGSPGISSDTLKKMRRSAVATENRYYADKGVEEEPASIDFSDALKLLKQGKKVARRGWNGKGMWLTLVVPDQARLQPFFEQYEDLAPFVSIKTVEGTLVPWTVSQSDLLAEDYEEV